MPGLVPGQRYARALEGLCLGPSKSKESQYSPALSPLAARLRQAERPADGLLDWLVSRSKGKEQGGMPLPLSTAKAVSSGAVSYLAALIRRVTYGLSSGLALILASNAS